MAVGLKVINGDIIINSAGKLDIVEESDKGSRDFGKMLITSKEFPSNKTSYSRYNPNYGTELSNKDLFTGLSRVMVRDLVISLLNEAIKDYLALQEARANLDLGEVITGVNFDVYYNAEDMRQLIIDINFTNVVSSSPISLGQYVQSIA